ncbi:CACNA1G [Symbiodinium pilosum]|uniref:CACNA1G protein n=1 Tax=Symbiodinium pilosum TaxID=2952 RepID=A0A812P6Z1_SYMPI|nr:CACNA1G [Symbiodinium pilosum]
MPGMLSEPNDNATSPAVAGESQRLRRRSTVGAHIFSRTPPAGVTDIRHSLLHSVAELDMPQAGQPSFRQSVLEMLTAPVLNQGDSWAVENEHRTVLSQVRVSLQRKVVETTWFEGLVVFCIGLNTVMIGAASDWNLKHLHQDEPTQFQDAERLFAGIFALELFVRMFVYGPGFFWRVDWQWNYFDVAIVSVQLFEEASMILGQDNQGEIQLSTSSSAIRIIRTFRLLRILRIVRLLRFIQELRSMLFSIFSTLRALGWTMVLLAMIIFAAAVFFAQFIIDAGAINKELMLQHPDLQLYFSDLSRTMLTLYQSMTGGLSWDLALRPLVDTAGAWIGIPYALYVAFVVLALMNIATGMFVQASLNAHERQREKEIRRQLRLLFRNADLNQDGDLTMEEFDRFLDDTDKSKYFLSALGMEAQEARGLFLLLDTTECSKVSFDELLDGVLRLRGAAQAIDLATLMYCNKRMISWLRDRLGALQDSVDILHGLHGAPRVSRPRKMSVFASWKEVMTRVGDQRHTVVLVGVTGDGKSSTGNALCGQAVFPVSGGLHSETQELAHADYLCGGSFWRVIDTVGLNDTGLSQAEVLDRFSTFAEAAAEGISVFLFVVRWGRFKPEHDEALAAFAANCGEVALRHTLLVFTHCDLSDEALARQLSDTSTPASLTRWLQRIGGGAVGINNVESASARTCLQKAIERTVMSTGGMRYSNDALTQARANLREAEEAERKAFAAAVAEWRRSTGPAAGWNLCMRMTWQMRLLRAEPRSS